jgi:hypothetical protein
VDIEYLADIESRYRDDVVFPRVARRAMLERELARARPRPGPQTGRDAPGTLLGGLMLRVAGWFGGSGPRPAAPAG